MEYQSSLCCAYCECSIQDGRMTMLGDDCLHDSCYVQLNNDLDLISPCDSGIVWDGSSEADADKLAEPVVEFS